MVVPVVLGGVTYERVAAEAWLAEHCAVSPTDGQPLPEGGAALAPTHVLRGILRSGWAVRRLSLRQTAAEGSAPPPT